MRSRFATRARRESDSDHSGAKRHRRPKIKNEPRPKASSSCATVAAATRLPVWMQLLGAALPRNAAVDPQNKPYVGLHTPDIDGDPADSEFPTAVAVEHVGTFGERARAQR